MIPASPAVRLVVQCSWIAPSVASRRIWPGPIAQGLEEPTSLFLERQEDESLADRDQGLEDQPSLGGHDHVQRVIPLDPHDGDLVDLAGDVGEVLPLESGKTSSTGLRSFSVAVPSTKTTPRRCRSAYRRIASRPYRSTATIQGTWHAERGQTISSGHFRRFCSRR